MADEPDENQEQAGGASSDIYLCVRELHNAAYHFGNTSYSATLEHDFYAHTSQSGASSLNRAIAPGPR